MTEALAALAAAVLVGTVILSFVRMAKALEGAVRELAIQNALRKVHLHLFQAAMSKDDPPKGDTPKEKIPVGEVTYPEGEE